jgi:hypothetical protein
MANDRYYSLNEVLNLLMDDDVGTGALKVSLASLIAGEDLAVGVMKTEKRGGYVSINSAATTLVKTGPGHINSLRVIGGTLGAVTVYDNTAASGTAIVPTVTPAAAGLLIEDVDFNTGCTILTAAATIITGSVR